MGSGSYSLKYYVKVALNMLGSLHWAQSEREYTYFHYLIFRLGRFGEPKREAIHNPYYIQPRFSLRSSFPISKI